MITRRIIRIKILQIIFSYLFSENKTIDQTEKELFFSLEKFYDLYHKLLYFIVDLKKHAESRIEIARSKKVPTHKDLNPNTKFIENQVITQIENNEELRRYINKKKLEWSQKKDFIKNFYNHLIESDIFKQYMDNPERSYNEDKIMVIQIYAHFLADYEPLYQQLEEQSIYWNDEVDLLINVIVKVLKNLKKEQHTGKLLFPMFKKEEDKDFAKQLLKKTIMKYSEYDDLIKKNSENWDLERIAVMDVLIMKMAITEMLEFTSIPTKVTLDEYIEIAKFYSTEKSNIFINGILDKIITQLKDENRIQKHGRGLIGEV
ncbi:MAG: transcription antitermination factor NusB [Bacteroidales bacterium]|nr:transcription antitermination factor NusB [Bacteroidales bacterium]